MSVTSFVSHFRRLFINVKCKCKRKIICSGRQRQLSYLSLAFSSESIVFLYIGIVWSCQQWKSRTGQPGCDAVLAVSWAHSSKSARAKGMISSCIWLRDYSQRAPTCPRIEPSFELSFNPSRELAVPVTESRRDWRDAAVSSTVPFQVLWDTGRGE